MTTNSETRVENLQQNAVLLSVERGRLRTRKRVSSSSVQSDTDPNLLHVSKDILESEQLDAVAQVLSRTSNYLNRVCLPGPFRAGMYLLPVKLIPEATKRLDEERSAFTRAVADFMAFYQTAHAFATADDETADQLLADNPVLAPFADSKARLGSLWNPSDYPQPAQVQAKFLFEYALMEMQTPGKLKSVSKELYQREMAKIQNVWEGATDKIASVLLEEFQGLTRHLADRLTPDADGNAKTLRTSTMKKMNDWLALFAARNLASDEQLAAMVEKARRLVNGIDQETIRESDALRTELAQDFQSLAAEVTQAVIDRPARRMDFTE